VPCPFPLWSRRALNCLASTSRFFVAMDSMRAAETDAGAAQSWLLSPLGSESPGAGVAAGAARSPRRLAGLLRSGASKLPARFGAAVHAQKLGRHAAEIVMTGSLLSAPGRIRQRQHWHQQHQQQQPAAVSAALASRPLSSASTNSASHLHLSIIASRSIPVCPSMYRRRALERNAC